MRTLGSLIVALMLIAAGVPWFLALAAGVAAVLLGQKWYGWEG